MGAPADGKKPPAAQWVHFLRSHDELDLGRLSPEQRATVFAEFAPDKSMQLYDRGIRRRLAPMLKNDRRRLELAFDLQFSLPGTPMMQYGDEIGMGDDTHELTLGPYGHRWYRIGAPDNTLNRTSF